MKKQRYRVFLLGLFFLAVEILEVYLYFSLLLILILSVAYFFFVGISLLSLGNNFLRWVLFTLVEMMIITASFKPFVLSIFIMAAVVGLCFQELIYRGKLDFH